ncbi:MAG TPA: hypothetical protein VGE97_04435 [Nitrososphaera sp.]
MEDMNILSGEDYTFSGDIVEKNVEAISSNLVSHAMINTILVIGCSSSTGTVPNQLPFEKITENKSAMLGKFAKDNEEEVH